MLKVKSEVRFIFYASSIFICYFVFGMLQEKITRGKYGVSDKYTCSLTLVLIQCVVNYIFAQILMLSWNHEKDTTRKMYYFASALTYLLAMVCSVMALQYINYPTQVVGKAAKPIPVMILGVLIGRKVYPLKKYLFVFLIVVGIVMFMYKDQGKKAINDDSQGVGIGEVLLILSLTMDGLTGAVQERIKSESAPTAYSMMLNTNWWSSIIITVGVILSGEILEFWTFVSKYPEVIIYIISFALTGALGQLFIFYMVAEFGPLPCAVVTTTRKFFTVLASVIIFGNVLLARQWLGAILVFTGLFLDIFYNKGKAQSAKKEQIK
ncbi:solute carrier family 35 member B1 homolog [Maniola jurtina]|uniref:solute carrier family 35 member B1 homolog n=1 Tax=Maniola jurtina TaxID=191418 RepID=UPI001E68E5B0|nr:solute carrier family 35 member B1 homolog [Maniola jurtina]